MSLKLIPFKEENREIFIKDLQDAFQLGFIEKYNITDEVISKEEIDESINAENAQTFHIIRDDEIVGGVVVTINEDNHNELDLLFVKVGSHGGGIGQKVWKMIEETYPKTITWQTHTPYFDERNIHFYVNKCGFKIVEFFNKYHNDPANSTNPHSPANDESFFRFEKVMK